jgi:uncharacterized membrane protein
MVRIGAKAQKWLKSLHLVAVGCWVGGGVSLIMLHFLRPGTGGEGVLYGINQAAHQVDMAVVVVPGAFGCLLTGLAYSLLTGWGFFKHGWLVFKWVVTVSAIIFGTFWLGPWETAMMDISGELGVASLKDGAYLDYAQMNFVWGTVQVAVLAATVFISVLKPWKNLGKRNG